MSSKKNDSKGANRSFGGYGRHTYGGQFAQNDLQDWSRTPAKPRRLLPAPYFPKDDTDWDTLIDNYYAHLATKEKA
jgi:hypothetical protein